MRTFCNLISVPNAEALLMAFPCAPTYHYYMDGGARDPGAVRGPDPTAPDVEGARRRYPDWSFWREGNTWQARRADGSSQLTGLSLESLEGRVARAEKARANGLIAPKSAGEGGPPATRPPQH
jgi:hypothetical protein